MKDKKYHFKKLDFCVKKVYYINLQMELSGMNKTFIDKQIITAKENFNYFFMKTIILILQTCFKLAIMLLINQIFNYTIVNIISIIYTIVSIYNIYNNINNYNKIMTDIKNTLHNEVMFYEIDLDVISKNLFRGVVNYGK